MPRYRYLTIPESEVTPKSVFDNRRHFLRQSFAIGARALLLPNMLLPKNAHAWADVLKPALDSDLPSQELAGGEALTEFRDATTYNNFYEFGTRKRDPEVYAHNLSVDPWSVVLEGELNNKGTIPLEEILRRHSLEECVYRLGCVEGR